MTPAEVTAWRKGIEAKRRQNYVPTIPLPVATIPAPPVLAPQRKAARKKSGPRSSPANAIPLDLLKRMYVDEQLSSQEIGARLGVRYTTVAKRLKDAGLMRTKSEAGLLRVAKAKGAIK